MPVEIRELVIRATVTKDKEQEAKSPDTTSNNSVTPQQELIVACIEKMTAMQNDKNDR